MEIKHIAESEHWKTFLPPPEAQVRFTTPRDVDRLMTVDLDDWRHTDADRHVETERAGWNPSESQEKKA